MIGEDHNMSMLRYRGDVSDEQVAWGSNDDPRGLLKPGAVYEVEKVESHSWHTKIYLVGYPGKKFNSVHFDEVE